MPENFEKIIIPGGFERKETEEGIKLEKFSKEIRIEKPWPFESLPQKELKKQYESQREILERVGILGKLSTNEIGIKGIDNKEYAFPQYPEIIEGMKEDKEILKIKIEQGFNQLLIAPFGMKLNDLIEKYKWLILKHYRERKLLATKGEFFDFNKHLELNESEPVWAHAVYNNAEIKRRLVYFPKEYSKNHQGKTKQEILNQTKNGFNILFIENLPNIPREDEGKKIKSRKQLEAGRFPNHYLEILKTDPQYQNETGTTPEEWITYAIKHLEQTNQVIDDYEGRGSRSFQLGAFFPAAAYYGGFVPRAHWDRFCRQVILGRSKPTASSFIVGLRTVVRL